MDFIVDLKELDRYTHIDLIGTSKAIDNGVENIITPQLLLCNKAVNKGYNVYINNYENYVDINKKMKVYNNDFYDIIMSGIINKDIGIDLNKYFNQNGFNEEYFKREMFRYCDVEDTIYKNISFFISVYGELISNSEYNDVYDLRHPLYKKLYTYMDKTPYTNFITFKRSINNDKIKPNISYNYNNEKFKSIDIPIELITSTGEGIKEYANVLFQQLLYDKKRYHTRSIKAKENIDKKDYDRLKKKFEKAELS